MKIKIVILLCLIVLENIILWQISKFSFNLNELKKVHNTQVGLREACNKIQLNDDFSVVLKKLSTYEPLLEFNKDQTTIHFKLDSTDSPGNALTFDKNNKLITKKCGDSWEPKEN